MRFKVWCLLLACILTTGCEVRKERKPVPASDIAKAVQQAQADLTDELAVMPAWYRVRCQASWRKSSTEETKGIPVVLYSTLITETATPWVNPTPLWRIAVICAVFSPFLIALAVNPFDDDKLDAMFSIKDRDEGEIFWTGIMVTIGLAILAVVIPFVVCWPIYGLFQLLAYGFTGEGYYMPWHFVTFCLYGVLFALLGIATAPSLLQLMKSGVSVKAALGIVGLLLELAGLAFTIRDLLGLVSWH